MSDLTILLNRLREGDRTALDALMAEVYPELKDLAHRHLGRERASHTLSTVNLVNEAFLRLAARDKLEFENRAHFFGVAARVMRSILVDYARARQAAKRDPNNQAVVMPEVSLSAPEAHLVTVLDLDRLLVQLETEDSELCQVVEMRFFAGMTAEEMADATGRSVHVVRHDLRLAQAWLRRAAEQG